VADTTNAHVQAIDLPASLGPYSLVFSPDGTRLLISARTDADDLVIVVANADGSDPHKAADGRAPEWRPVPNDR
jgi:hypothetical protein